MSVELTAYSSTYAVPQNSLVSSRAPPLFIGGSFQDGKSNEWEIESEMEIENKSGEEKTGSDLAAIGGFAVFAKRFVQVMAFLWDIIYISDEDINIICGEASMSKGFIGEEKETNEV